MTHKKIFQISKKRSHMQQNQGKWSTIFQGSLPRGISWDLLNFLSMGAYEMMSTRKLVIESTRIDFRKNAPWDQLLPNRYKTFRLSENKQAYEVCYQLKGDQTQWECYAHMNSFETQVLRYQPRARLVSRPFMDSSLCCYFSSSLYSKVIHV